MILSTVGLSLCFCQVIETDLLACCEFSAQLCSHSGSNRSLRIHTQSVKSAQCVERNTFTGSHHHQTASAMKQQQQLQYRCLKKRLKWVGTVKGIFQTFGFRWFKKNMHNKKIPIEVDCSVFHLLQKHFFANLLYPCFLKLLLATFMSLLATLLVLITIFTIWDSLLLSFFRLGYFTFDYLPFSDCFDHFSSYLTSPTQQCI